MKRKIEVPRDERNSQSRHDKFRKEWSEHMVHFINQI